MANERLLIADKTGIRPHRPALTPSKLGRPGGQPPPEPPLHLLLDLRGETGS